MLFLREPLVQDHVNRCFRECTQEAMAYFLPACDPMRGCRIWAAYSRFLEHGAEMTGS